MAYHIEPGYVHSTVLKLLQERQRNDVSIKSIANDLNNQGIEYQWLYKLSTGFIKAPDVNKMEILYTHLTGQKIDVAA